MSKSTVPTTATGHSSLTNGWRNFLFFAVVKPKKPFFRDMVLCQRAVSSRKFRDNAMASSWRVQMSSSLFQNFSKSRKPITHRHDVVTAEWKIQ